MHKLKLFFICSVVCRKACSCGSEEILKDNKVLRKKVICKYKPIIATITHNVWHMVSWGFNPLTF